MACSRQYEIEHKLEGLVEMYVNEVRGEDEPPRIGGLVQTFSEHSEPEYSTPEFLVEVTSFLKNVDEIYTTINNQPYSEKWFTCGVAAAFCGMFFTPIFSDISYDYFVPASMALGWAVQNIGETDRKSKLFDRSCNKLIHRYSFQLKALIIDK